MAACSGFSSVASAVQKSHAAMGKHPVLQPFAGQRGVSMQSDVPLRDVFPVICRKLSFPIERTG